MIVGAPEMASSNLTENAIQCKTCRGEGDPNTRATRTSDNPDKQSNKCPNCQVFKSGPLFLSSKGIGWTSWKKRWFVLTRTSLVFFRSDPNSLPQKGSEANLTLGGIDLNNSGSVVVKADKKLLTVLFPDGRDGRTFTLKAETSEDLYEWKSALENALALAPGACAMGQNGIFCNDVTESIEASGEPLKDEEPEPVNSMVIGRPILLALEDIDGSPSFLEKALRFIEEYGIKVEGILRQSADVEEVKRRVKEYEQGKIEFSSDEDAHVIGDCIKYVLRELPSSPVPASCCTALVDAYRTDHGDRIDDMHSAIYETFPEPNRRLVQRILKMMRTVAYHRSENRMSLSALAACMAPLLLRPLLAGDCEFEDDFTMGGDGSIQLLQAAAAANHAQAIVIILLEEYENIFDEDLLEEGSFSSELYSESEDGDVEDDGSTDHDFSEDDDIHDGHNGIETDIDDDPECSCSGTPSERSSFEENDPYDDKATEDHGTDGSSPRDYEVEPSNTRCTHLLQQDQDQKLSTYHNTNPEDVDVQKNKILQYENINSCAAPSCKSHESTVDVPPSTEPMPKSISNIVTSNVEKTRDKSNEPTPKSKQRTVWGRTSARKNLSMESIDYSSEDEISIQRLESTKNDLQAKIAKEVKGNAILQASLERRKETLHERRLALEQDVERLRVLLQKERDLRASLESGLMNMRPGNISYTSAVDTKTRADLEEVALAEADIISLKQKVADLRGQLKNQPQKGYVSLCESCRKPLYNTDKTEGKDQKANINRATLINQNEMLSESDKQDVSSGAACKKMQKPAQDLQSPPYVNPSHGQKQESASQDNTISSGTSGCSSKEGTILGTLAPSKKFSSKDESAVSLADHKDVKAQKQGSPSLPSTQSLLNQQNFMLAADSENVKGLRRDRVSTSDRQPSQKRQTNASNMSSMLAADVESVRSAGRDSASTSDRQPSQKQQTSTSNMSSSTSLGSTNIPSTEGPTAVGWRITSKKSFPGGDNVKGTQDSPSLPNRRPSQKRQPDIASVNGSRSLGSNNGSSSEESAAVGRTASSKKPSSRPEETTSSSSALVKLTNRLNFLKERRAQLVNELQNMDINRTSGPEGPPPRTNSR